MLKRLMISIAVLVIALAGAGKQASGMDDQAMDKLMAPIALYPDALLAQALTCSASPDQVKAVNEWLKRNISLKGTDLQRAAQAAGFAPGFIGMVLFPDVLSLMEKKMEWTTEVGRAFMSDPKIVLESVQRLRARARGAGSIASDSRQEVRIETEKGSRSIVIEPANPQVVYVPVYDPEALCCRALSFDQAKTAAAFSVDFASGAVLAGDDRYGYSAWSAWAISWRSGAVSVRGAKWRAPVHGSYRYTAKCRRYRPSPDVVPPSCNDIKVNIVDSVNNIEKSSGGTQPPGTVPRPGDAGHDAQAAAAPVPASAEQNEEGIGATVFSGYRNGNSENAASQRGRASSGSRENRREP